MATAEQRISWPHKAHKSSNLRRTQSLATVPAGTTVRIGTVEGERDVCMRLLEMGFTPGQEVTPVATAPFGGPVAIAVRGTIVALRGSEAACLRL